MEIGYEIDNYNQFGFKDRAKMMFAHFVLLIEKKQINVFPSLGYRFFCKSLRRKGQLHTFKRKEYKTICKTVLSTIKAITAINL
jgi:hypothetical protein